MERITNTAYKIFDDVARFWTGSFQSQTKTIYQIVRDNGYLLIAYKYVTEDNYINTCFRLIAKKDAAALKERNKNLREKAASLYMLDDAEHENVIGGVENDLASLINQGKQPIILQHGFLDSATCWLMNEKDSIAFRLVDAGFDVWLNNSRGNRYSIEHQYLDIEYPEIDKKDEASFPSIDRQRQQYFDYSFHEMATFDLPALFSLVIKITGQEKINYIGHSQGTTQMFVSLMGKSDFYRKHLKTFVALAPCAYLHHADVDFAYLYNKHQSARDLIESQGCQIMPHPVGNTSYSRTFLGTQEGGMHFLIGESSDKDTSLVSPVAMTNISGHFPAGTSLKSFEHLRQIYDKFELTMFDYDAE